MLSLVCSDRASCSSVVGGMVTKYWPKGPVGCG